jgi:uncharacterized paraquat-inducible protein A
MRRLSEEATMLTNSHQLQTKTINRCAVCDGKFGLVRYYSWRTGLCSKRCRERLRQRHNSDFQWLIGVHAA